MLGYIGLSGMTARKWNAFESENTLNRSLQLILNHI